MRKLICFVLASGLVGAGLYLIYLEVFVATIIMGRMLAMGGLLGAIGSVWLWADFVVPMWQGREVG